MDVVTTEQAQALANRWSWWDAMGWPTVPDGLEGDGLTRWLGLEGIADRPLTDDECERLFAWVRTIMAGAVERVGLDSPVLHGACTVDLIKALGWTDTVAAWVLCEAVGWPA